MAWSISRDEVSRPLSAAAARTPSPKLTRGQPNRSDKARATLVLPLAIPPAIASATTGVLTGVFLLFLLLKGATAA
jgi:hypothetical protein